jgi:hypothetical protein
MLGLFKSGIAQNSVKKALFTLREGVFGFLINYNYILKYLAVIMLKSHFLEKKFQIFFTTLESPDLNILTMFFSGYQRHLIEASDESNFQPKGTLPKIRGGY